MKSALKKSVVSTSISLILASGMAAFAAHAADDVKLKMTVENVNTAVKQYLSHPVNTYTGVLLPK
ncbi:hypothetical protein ACSHE4_004089 [Escherichia coli]|nr:hypothetical protein [Escherichia coli]